jgi:deoxyadenosine/deoxycytidine kinase
MSRPILISIEGNIGSGKSTLLAQLKDRNPHWRFVDEPVSSWLQFKDADGKSLLELFYADKKRWAYTFQNTALLTRLEATRGAVEQWLHETQKNNGAPQGPQVFLTERCVDTDYNIFAKLMTAGGDMNSMETDLYHRWFHAFGATSLRPSAYIYVNTPAELCVHRIARRGREGEGAIPLDYLKDLEEAHESWLAPHASVFRYDNYTSLPHSAADVERFVASVVNSS